ncbi:MAG: hypothetical protein JRN45_00640 [Nitrososphaerota archaeon]|nr:hypothetical protein [Nitrososphaerota archaeon]
MTSDQAELLEKLKERLKGDIVSAIDKAFEDFVSATQLSPYLHKVTFSPPVKKEEGPFRSMVSRMLEDFRTKKKVEYRVVEGKPGEVVVVEFNAPSEEDRKAIERYAKWVQDVSAKAPDV